MFSSVSSCFNKIKRLFYKAVQEARQPFKRPFEEISDDDDFPPQTRYAPVRKKLCPMRDEPCFPMTRTLHYTPTLRCVPQRRCPLQSIPEDRPPQSRNKVDNSDVKIISYRKANSSHAVSPFPWTPVWPQEQDATLTTPRRIILPKLKTHSKQKPGSGSSEKELQVQRMSSTKRTSIIQPRHCLETSNHKPQMKASKPLSSPSKRFSFEESFRMEEKKQYKQLLEQCNSNSLPSSSHTASQISSSSSTSSSSLPTPVYEVIWPGKSSHPLQQEAGNENVVTTSYAQRNLFTSESKTPSFGKKDYSEDIITRYFARHKDLALKPLHSGATNSKNANINHSRVGSLSKCEQQKLDKDENTTLHELTQQHVGKERNNLIPLIDIGDSDNDSVSSVKMLDSDGESVEIVAEFPHTDKRTELQEYMQCKHGSLTLAVVAIESDEDVENESDRRKRASQNIYSKVENRMKLLDIISDAKEKKSSKGTKVKQPFVPLTTKMLSEVDAALVLFPKSEVLVHKFNIKVTRRDIHTLEGLNWLNDEIVNFYMNLIMERSKEDHKLPSMYAVNTFFYPKLLNQGHQSVSRWTKKVDIFAYDILLVPIHLGVHWCMASVNFRKKCISYYDSMLGDNDKCLELLLNYLEVEHLDKKSTPYRTTSWKLENVKDIPEQMNGSDCGVFSCQFAEHKSRRAPINFDQGDMPYFRMRMVYEIVNAKLLE